MNILLLGSGGREHAFAWKMKQSKLCENLYVMPGNAGTASLATNLSGKVSDFEKIIQYIQAYAIQMVVVGPEEPLVLGIREYIEQTFGNKIAIVGPGKKGAQLEGSKAFSKDFMVKNQIPTASAYLVRKENLNEGYLFLQNTKAPYVLKADGLAAGKGVVITNDIEEAKQILDEMIVHQKFGDAGNQVLIEQYLDGIEVSIFVITDGNSFLLLPEAKDYKRIGDGDTGLNTGGMGAVSPVFFVDEKFLDKVKKRIVEPTLIGLKNENIPYQGFLFIGLMNIQGEPYVIEYNVRMGDPETQAVLPRITSDWVEILYACATQSLHNIELNIDPAYSTTVVMAASGYPENYTKGDPITFEMTEDTQIFHAGTTKIDGQLLTQGGRVMAIQALGNSLAEAIQKSYEQVQKVVWKNRYFRHDIGQDLMKKEF